jgi:hypothetical protein
MAALHRKMQSFILLIVAVLFFSQSSDASGVSEHAMEIKEVIGDAMSQQLLDLITIDAFDKIR